MFVEKEEPIPWDCLEESISTPRTCCSILTGSNHQLAEALHANWTSNFPTPITIEGNASIPIQSLVEVPEKVGADRLLNAVAVNAMRSPETPAIIIDSGTAATVDVVNGNGAFLGGAILPGVLMGASALHEFTTTLPLIDGREFLEYAPKALGNAHRSRNGKWALLGPHRSHQRVGEPTLREV